jgi:hypothetical protein
MIFILTERELAERKKARELAAAKKASGQGRGFPGSF